MNEPDYFARKRQQLGLDRADSLAGIQATLDTLYPALTRAVSLNGGVLKIATPNASVASDLRLRQMELLDKFGQADIKRIQIVIS